MWEVGMMGEAAFSLAASLAFGAVVPLAALAWRARSLVWVLTPAVVQLAGLLAWALTRDALRRAALAPVYSPTAVPVHPQWGAFALFAVVFVAGLGVIGWLVKQSLPATKA